MEEEIIDGYLAPAKMKRIWAKGFSFIIKVVVKMDKSALVNSIESLMPRKMVGMYRELKRFFRWMFQKNAYYKAVHKIRNKNNPLNVLFIINDSSLWKFDSVYRLMEKDVCFNPLILVCPNVRFYDENQANSIYNRTCDFFCGRGYNVMKSCERLHDEGVDVDSMHPDLVFYSSLWTGYMASKYNQQSLRKYLKCYVNYGFISINDVWSYASAFHGLMWRYFVECSDVMEDAKKIAPYEMQNIVVTGYPIFDEYEQCKGDASAWKDANPKYKRVIWAPHHSIEGHDGLLKLSTFLENADAMLAFAESHSDKFQFVFKPHPLLRQALYNHPKWGKGKTDDYYGRWENGVNTSLVTGSYMDLFKSSDAMIHDCGSFIVEYLYTQKPVLYLGRSREEQSNIVGIKAYANHYHGTTVEDVESFLTNVVLNGIDPMKTQREQFYNEVLLPPNGCTVAENIVNEIKKELNR